MISRRRILYALVLLPCLLAHGAAESAALQRYNASRDEIARSYKQQFAEIRKSQLRIGSEKADFRAAEQRIEELGRIRSKAIAEAKLTYQEELRQTDPAPAAKISREQRQREFWAARRQLFEDGQKAFWEGVAREQPKVAELQAERRQSVEKAQTNFWAGLPLKEAHDAELMAARRQAVQKQQTAFWAELFEAPKTIPNDPRPMAANTQRVAKQMSPETAPKNTNLQMQHGRALAAAN